jgi:hypothetical protein
VALATVKTMKIHHLLAIRGLVIRLVLPTFAQEKDTSDPQVPEQVRARTLLENMPQHDGQPSEGDESHRNNHQIELLHPLLIFPRPTKLLLNCWCTLCRTNQSLGFHVPLFLGRKRMKHSRNVSVK